MPLPCKMQYFRLMLQESVDFATKSPRDRVARRRPGGCMTSAEAAALLAAMPHPTLLVGPDSRIMALNPGARALFGTAAVGRHHVTVLRRPALLEAVAAAAAGEVRAGRVTLTEGERQGVHAVHAAPVGAEGGQGVLLTLEDVSAREEAEQMRRDFVANVSHELKTPLTALMGFIETLSGRAAEDAEARGRFLAIMAREAERMNRLVADLLSLSRVEAEERMRPGERVDAVALVREAVASLRPLAEESGAALDLTSEEETLQVPGDADQLTQVFTNLIENAIKYGGGAVQVSVARLARDAALRAPALGVSVADDGPGIDPAHIPRLTERFYRVDTHRSRELGGTGLGLAIVKHIVSRHRGRLKVESRPGEGSRFTVLLPED